MFGFNRELLFYEMILLISFSVSALWRHVPARVRAAVLTPAESPGMFLAARQQVKLGVGRSCKDKASVCRQPQRVKHQPQVHGVTRHKGEERESVTGFRGQDERRAKLLH